MPVRPVPYSQPSTEGEFAPISAKATGLPPFASKLAGSVLPVSISIIRQATRRTTTAAPTRSPIHGTAPTSAGHYCKAFSRKPRQSGFSRTAYSSAQILMAFKNAPMARWSKTVAPATRPQLDQRFHETTRIAVGFDNARGISQGDCLAGGRHFRSRLRNGLPLHPAPTEFGLTRVRIIRVQSRVNPTLVRFPSPFHHFLDGRLRAVTYDAGHEKAALAKTRAKRAHVDLPRALAMRCSLNPRGHGLTAVPNLHYSFTQRPLRADLTQPR